MVAVAKTPNVGLSEDDLLRSICRESFYQFVKTFWSTIISEEPVWNWHIKVLCDEVQLVAERVFRGEPKLYDLVINVPPSSTKSTIVSIMFPVWCWTRAAYIRTIGASYTDLLALDLSRKGRLIVKSELYQRLFPAVQLRDDQDTKTYYETTEGGDRHSVGSEGDIDGFHAHFLLVDDPINPGDVHSAAALRKVNRWLKETLFSRKVDKQVSVVIIIMQRLHEEDPSGMMLAEAKAHPDKIKVRHICLPGEESDRVSPKRYRLKYQKDAQGNSLLDLVRAPRAVLEEARIRLGPFGYSGQIEQWPVPPEGGMFKVAKIQVGIPPPLMKFRRIVRY